MIAMRSTLVLASLLSVLTAPIAARCQRARDQGPPFSVFGGELLRSSESTIAAGFGWPGLFVQYDAGVSQRFGIGFRGDLFFGSPVGGFDTGMGFGLSVPMRLQLIRLRRVGIALKLAPRFFVGQLDVNRGKGHPDDELLLGFGFETGPLVSVHVHRQIDVIAGLTVPFLLAVDVDDRFSEVWFPVVAFGGAELSLSRDFNLWSTVSIGPAIHGGELATKAEAYFWFMFGFEYRI
ncbi:MAG: hypothetical protein HYY06_16955 [Deltaproteobacteria bacterium]|nr:hypothetical protein [Deltaproteobacteria bacterium]